MKFLKLFIMLVFLCWCHNAYAQNIIKIVKQFVLINNVDEFSGLSVGDRLPVFRTTGSGNVSRVGEVQIVKFVKGKCAAKIVSESRNMKIAVGDYIDLNSDAEELLSSQKDKFSSSSGPGDIGIEKGDSEVQFAGFYVRMMTEGFSMGTAFIQCSFAKFITSRLQLGIAPILNISEFSVGSNSETTTQFSASAFCNYNLKTAAKLIPYVSGQWYQGDFSPEYGDFTDYSYITVGAGFRNFFNEYAALNTSISYGFPLGSNSEGGLLTISSGLSFIF